MKVRFIDLSIAHFNRVLLSLFSRKDNISSLESRRCLDDLIHNCRRDINDSFRRRHLIDLFILYNIWATIVDLGRRFFAHDSHERIGKFQLWIRMKRSHYIKKLSKVIEIYFLRKCLCNRCTRKNILCWSNCIEFIRILLDLNIRVDRRIVL